MNEKFQDKQLSPSATERRLSPAPVNSVALIDNNKAMQLSTRRTSRRLHPQSPDDVLPPVTSRL